MSRVRIRNTLLVLLLLLISLGLAINYLLSWRPDERESVDVRCSALAPVLQAGQPLKVMTWNIQYLAGDRYQLWEALPPSSPHRRPSDMELSATIDEAVRVLRDEAPDVILLQEVDDGSSLVSEHDQMIQFRERLGDLYTCITQSYEWKSVFMPNANVIGPVGRKLVILSRYRIDTAERVQLPRRPGSLIERLFGSRPALLTSTLPVDDGQTLTLLNTRLDRPSHADDDTQRRQITLIADELERLEQAKKQWLLGGDFNLSSSGPSELSVLTDHYPVIPSSAESSGPDRQTWFTEYPSRLADPNAGRTVDYLFHSLNLTRSDAYVRKDTASISNHRPLIGHFLLPH